MIHNKIKFPAKNNVDEIKKYFQRYKILKYLKHSIENNSSKKLKSQINPWTKSTYPPEIIDYIVCISLLFLIKD